MKFVLSAALAACVLTGAALAANATEQKLIDLETAWSKALVARDIAALSNIVADDWSGQDDSGTKLHKASFIELFKKGTVSITKMTNHDVSARVFGNVAVVQGMDDETSASKGKDTSGTYTWTDVFENRGGKWVAIASQITKVAK